MSSLPGPKQCSGRHFGMGALLGATGPGRRVKGDSESPEVGMLACFGASKEDPGQVTGTQAGFLEEGVCRARAPCCHTAHGHLSALQGSMGKRS